MDAGLGRPVPGFVSLVIQNSVAGECVLIRELVAHARGSVHDAGRCAWQGSHDPFACPGGAGEHSRKRKATTKGTTAVFFWEGRSCGDVLHGRPGIRAVSLVGSLAVRTGMLREEQSALAAN